MSHTIAMYDEDIASHRERIRAFQDAREMIGKHWPGEGTTEWCALADEVDATIATLQEEERMMVHYRQELRRSQGLERVVR